MSVPGVSVRSAFMIPPVTQNHFGHHWYTNKNTYKCMHLRSLLCLHNSVSQHKYKKSTQTHTNTERLWQRKEHEDTNARIRCECEALCQLARFTCQSESHWQAQTQRQTSTCLYILWGLLSACKILSASLINFSQNKHQLWEFKQSHVQDSQPVWDKWPDSGWVFSIMDCIHTFVFETENSYLILKVPVFARFEFKQKPHQPHHQLLFLHPGRLMSWQGAPHWKCQDPSTDPTKRWSAPCVTRDSRWDWNLWFGFFTSFKRSPSDFLSFWTVFGRPGALACKGRVLLVREGLGFLKFRCTCHLLIFSQPPCSVQQGCLPCATCLPMCRATEVIWRSLILSWPRIKFSKRICYDFFNSRDKCYK